MPEITKSDLALLNATLAKEGKPLVKVNNDPFVIGMSPYNPRPNDPLAKRMVGNAPAPKPVSTRGGLESTEDISNRLNSENQQLSNTIKTASTELGSIRSPFSPLSPLNLGYNKSIANTVGKVAGGIYDRFADAMGKLTDTVTGSPSTTKGYGYSDVPTTSWQERETQIAEAAKNAKAPRTTGNIYESPRDLYQKKFIQNAKNIGVAKLAQSSLLNINNNSIAGIPVDGEIKNLETLLAGTGGVFSNWEGYKTLGIIKNNIAIKEFGITPQDVSMINAFKESDKGTPAYIALMNKFHKAGAKVQNMTYNNGEGFFLNPTFDKYIKWIDDGGLKTYKTNKEHLDTYISGGMEHSKFQALQGAKSIIAQITSDSLSPLKQEGERLNKEINNRIESGNNLTASVDGLWKEKFQSKAEYDQYVKKWNNAKKVIDDYGKLNKADELKIQDINKEFEKADAKLQGLDAKLFNTDYLKTKKAWDDDIKKSQDSAWEEFKSRTWNAINQTGLNLIEKPIRFFTPGDNTLSDLEFSNNYKNKPIAWNTGEFDFDGNPIMSNQVVYHDVNGDTRMSFKAGLATGAEQLGQMLAIAKTTKILAAGSALLKSGASRIAARAGVTMAEETAALSVSSIEKSMLNSPYWTRALTVPAVALSTYPRAYYDNIGKFKTTAELKEYAAVTTAFESLSESILPDINIVRGAATSLPKILSSAQQIFYKDFLKNLAEGGAKSAWKKSALQTAGTIASNTFQEAIVEEEANYMANALYEQYKKGENKDYRSPENHTLQGAIDLALEGTFTMLPSMLLGMGGSYRHFERENSYDFSKPEMLSFHRWNIATNANYFREQIANDDNLTPEQKHKATAGIASYETNLKQATQAIKKPDTKTLGNDIDNTYIYFDALLNKEKIEKEILAETASKEQIELFENSQKALELIDKENKDWIRLTPQEKQDKWFKWYGEGILETKFQGSNLKNSITAQKVALENRKEEVEELYKNKQISKEVYEKYVASHQKAFSQIEGKAVENFNASVEDENLSLPDIQRLFHQDLLEILPLVSEDIVEQQEFYETSRQKLTEKFINEKRKLEEIVAKEEAKKEAKAEAARAAEVAAANPVAPVLNPDGSVVVTPPAILTPEVVVPEEKASKFDAITAIGRPGQKQKALEAHFEATAPENLKQELIDYLNHTKPAKYQETIAALEQGNNLQALKLIPANLHTVVKKINTSENTAPASIEIINTPESIEAKRIETEAKIKRKDLFIGVGDFSTQLGGSDTAAVPISHKEINGIELVEYAHPKTGSIDVIVTGKSDNDFVGFYRLYENGKPTNKWSSKFENQSRNKEDFKTMMSGVQEMLPEGHEYTEKTSISTDGLRIWNQQLSRGYELQYDENGKVITNMVAINGDAIVNELGIQVEKGDFKNIKVGSKEAFEQVKAKILPYLNKFGLGEESIHWYTGTVKIDLPVLKKSTTAKNTTKTNVEQIADLRAEEQAEYAAMSNPNDQAKKDEIYSRYNKPISDLIALEEAAIEKRREKELKPYDERDVKNLEAIMPNNPNHPTIKVGMKKSNGLNVRVEKTNTDNWNGKGEGYTVITAVREPAEFDSEGKMTKPAKVEEAVFNSKEEAEAAIQATFEKVKSLAGKKQKEINARYNAELDALKNPVKAEQAAEQETQIPEIPVPSLTSPEEAEGEDEAGFSYRPTSGMITISDEFTADDKQIDTPFNNSINEFLTKLQGNEASVDSKIVSNAILFTNMGVDVETIRAKLNEYWALDEAKRKEAKEEYKAALSTLFKNTIAPSAVTWHLEEGNVFPGYGENIQGKNKFDKVTMRTITFIVTDKKTGKILKVNKGTQPIVRAFPKIMKTDEGYRFYSIFPLSYDKIQQEMEQLYIIQQDALTNQKISRSTNITQVSNGFIAKNQTKIRAKGEVEAIFEDAPGFPKGSIKEQSTGKRLFSDEIRREDLKAVAYLLSNMNEMPLGMTPKQVEEYVSKIVFLYDQEIKDFSNMTQAALEDEEGPLALKDKKGPLALKDKEPRRYNTAYGKDGRILDEAFNHITVGVDGKVTQSDTAVEYRSFARKNLFRYDVTKDIKGGNKKIYFSLAPVKEEASPLSNTIPVPSNDDWTVTSNSGKLWTVGELKKERQFFQNDIEDGINVNENLQVIDGIDKLIAKAKPSTEAAPVSTDVKANVVKVYHHTNVTPQDFNFESFQRGEQQVSQFGDGLNASSTTTPFLVQRYGNPIEGEINDSDFIVIDANKSEKELYEELKSKGYKFNNPATGSYIGNDTAIEYNSFEQGANENPSVISLFNDFQKSNPEVKGVKVINHIIGNQKVDPFYVIYNAKSFYGPGSLSKTQSSVSTDAKADAEQKAPTVASEENKPKQRTVRKPREVKGSDKNKLNTNTQTTVTSREQSDALDWFKSSFLLEGMELNISFMIEDPDAFASFSDIAYTLYKGSNYTMLYHEAWHRFTQHFLSKDEKIKLYEAVAIATKQASKFDINNFKQYEEALAEAFRMYMKGENVILTVGDKSVKINQEAPAQEHKGLIGMFKKMRNFFSSLFNRGKNVEITPEQLINEYFKEAKAKKTLRTSNPTNSYFTSLNTERIYKYYTADGDEVTFDYAALSELNQAIDYLFVETFNERSKDSKISALLYSAPEDRKEESSAIYNTIWNKLLEKANEQENITKQNEFNAVLDNWEQIVENASEFRASLTKKLKYKMFENEEGGQIKDDESKGLNAEAYEKLSNYEHASEEIINAVKVIPKLDKNGNKILSSYWGLPQLDDFNKNWTILSKNLANLTFPEMEVKLKHLASKKYPQFKYLLQSISPNYEQGKLTPIAVRNNFEQVFNMAYVPEMMTLLSTNKSGEQVIKFFESGTNISRELRNQWDSNYTNSTYQEELPNGDKKLNIAKLLEDFPLNKLEGNKEMMEFLKAIGVNYSHPEEVLAILESNSPAYKEFSPSITRIRARLQMMKDAVNIIYPLSTLYKDFNNKAGEGKAIDLFAALEIETNEEISDDQSLRPDGNSSWKFMQQSYITNFSKDLNKLSLEELIPLYPQLNYSTNPEILNSLWFNSLFRKEGDVWEKRPNNSFEYIKIGGLKSEDIAEGESTIDLTAPDKLVMDFFSFITKQVEENVRFADKSVASATNLISTIGYEKLQTPEEALPALTKQLINQLVGEVVQIKYIENIPIKERENIRLFDKHYKTPDFIYFNYLDPILLERVKQAALKDGLRGKEIADPLLQKELEEAIYNHYQKKATEFSYKFEDAYGNNELNYSKILPSKYNTWKPSEVFEYYYMYSTINRIEQFNFIYGSPRNYKTGADVFKRLAAYGAVGKYASIDEKFLNWSNSQEAYQRNIEKIYTGKHRTWSDKFNVIHFYDEKVNIPEYSKQALYNLDEKENPLVDKNGKPAQHPLYNPSYTEEERAQLANYYDQGEQTDANGNCTLDFYKQLLNSIGQWTPKQENAYKLQLEFERAKFNLEKEDTAENLKAFEEARKNANARIDDITSIFNIKKFQYSGSIYSQGIASKLDLRAFEKFSLAPLIPSVIENTRWEKIAENMYKNSVDMTNFNSGSKMNWDQAPQSFKTWHSGNIPKYSPSILSLTALKEQLPIDNQMKEEGIFASQMRKLLSQGLFNEGQTILGREIAIEQYETYKDAIKNITDIEKKKLEKKFSSPKKLVKYIKDEFAKRDIPDHVQEFIQYYEQEDRLATPLDLSFQSIQLQNVLFSIVNNKLIKQKLSGGQFIQAPNTGYRNNVKYTNAKKEDIERYKNGDLRFYRVEGNTVRKMEIKIAFTDKYKGLLNLVYKGKAIGNLDNLNKLLNDDAFVKEHGAKFTLVGCRIPVQGFSTIESMIVKEFLPAVAGQIVIVPEGLTIKSGSDFDIDKLNLYEPHINSTTGELYESKKDPVQYAEKIDENIKEWNQEKRKILSVIKDIEEKNKLKTLSKEKKAENDEKVKSLKEDVSRIETNINDLKKDKSNVLLGEVNRLISSISNIVLDRGNFLNLITRNELDILGDIYDSRGIEANDTPMYNIVDPITSNEFFRRNTVGKQSLGIAAKMNTFFALAVEAGLKMNTPSPSLSSLPENPNGSLSSLYTQPSISGKKGVYIPKVISEFISGLVDIAKDSRISEIYADKLRTPMYLYMIMKGSHPEDAVNFLMAPNMLKLVDTYQRQNSIIYKQYITGKYSDTAIKDRQRDALNKIKLDNGVYTTTYKKADNTEVTLRKKEETDLRKEVMSLESENSAAFELLKNKVIKDEMNKNSVTLQQFAVFVLDGKGEPKQNKYGEPIIDYLETAKNIISNENEVGNKELLDASQFYVLLEDSNKVTELSTAVSWDTNTAKSFVEISYPKVQMDKIKSDDWFNEEAIEKMEYESVIAPLESSKFVKTQFKNAFAIINKPAYIESVISLYDKVYGHKLENFSRDYQNDFFTYLFQNYAITKKGDSLYKNLLVDLKLLDKNNLDNIQARLNTIISNIKDPILQSNSFLNKIIFRKENKTPENAYNSIVPELKNSNIDVHTANLLHQDLLKLYNYPNEKLRVVIKELIQSTALLNGTNKTFRGFQTLIPTEEYTELFRDILSNPLLEEQLNDIDSDLYKDFIPLFQKNRNKYFPRIKKSTYNPTDRFNYFSPEIRNLAKNVVSLQDKKITLEQFKEATLKNIKEFNPDFEFSSQAEQPSSKIEREYTPENITSLKPNEVFVFGANTAGGHGGGTAGLAQRGTVSSNYTALPIGTKGKWSEYGIVDKLMQGTEGKSFGIVTKAATISGTSLKIGAKRSVSLSRIEESINALIKTANQNSDLKFLVTKFGTNMAGFSIEEMKALLQNKNLPNNIILPKEFEVREEEKDLPWNDESAGAFPDIKLDVKDEECKPIK